jgi:hypothetical protein
MDVIWYGLKLAIGLFLGGVVIIMVIRWLRIQWYLSKGPSEDVPDDIRKIIILKAVEDFRKMRPRLSPAERQKAASALLYAVAADKTLDPETQNELVIEAANLVAN